MQVFNIAKECQVGLGITLTKWLARDHKPHAFPGSGKTLHGLKNSISCDRSDAEGPKKYYPSYIRIFQLIRWFFSKDGSET